MSRLKGYRTIRDTVYLYPESDIQRALAITTYKYTDNGTIIMCPTITDFLGIYQDIVNQTAVSQPVGNVGFSLGVGTILEDLRKERQFCLTTGEVLVRWNLVRQISPQTTPPIATPGNSIDNTVGFVTTFCSYGPYPLPIAVRNTLDPVLVVRIG